MCKYIPYRNKDILLHNTVISLKNFTSNIMLLSNVFKFSSCYSYLLCYIASSLFFLVLTLNYNMNVEWHYHPSSHSFHSHNHPWFLNEDRVSENSVFQNTCSLFFISQPLLLIRQIWTTWTRVKTKLLMRYYIIWVRQMWDYFFKAWMSVFR